MAIFHQTILNKYDFLPSMQLNPMAYKAYILIYLFFANFTSGTSECTLLQGILKKFGKLFFKKKIWKTRVAEVSKNYQRRKLVFFFYILLVREVFFI